MEVNDFKILLIDDTVIFKMFESLYLTGEYENEKPEYNQDRRFTLSVQWSTLVVRIWRL